MVLQSFLCMSVSQRLAHGLQQGQRLVRLVFARPVEAEELALLRGLLAEGRKAYEAEPEAARARISVGESPPPETLDAVELAAWSLVASALFGTDEFQRRS